MKKCSDKNPKSDLNRLSYADFVNYTIAKHYEERKAVYEKTSEDYKKKLELKSAAESDYIKYLVDDYNNTNTIIDSMYSDMKYMCNDEDVSAEKRAEYINKCSKITNRLSDKRDFLINKIRSEDL